MTIFDKYINALGETDPIKYSGRVTGVRGILVESHGPKAAVGETCHIFSGKGETLEAEVVAVQNEVVQLMCLDSLSGLEIGDVVVASGIQPRVAVSSNMLGRVIDPLGRPIDGKGPIGVEMHYPIHSDSPSPMDRSLISRRIDTGIRAIDALLPVGKGQRMGIFSGSGVGKSTLLGMVARNTSADVNVVALIGERGREVREFIETDLGEEGLKRSVLVVSTSDTTALSRVRGAYTATAVAEYFRDKGNDVMFLFDSVTRFALSQREIGLTVGEPPTNRGYTPSVFSLLPKLIERTGTSPQGTITSFYTVLVEGDDMDEPVSDAVRGYLDGHLVLDRGLAEKNHYPAIDILSSISRVAPKLVTEQTRKALGKVRHLVAAYREKEDLIDVGAYAQGSDPVVDEAIEKQNEINAFLKQEITEHEEAPNIFRRLSGLAGIEIPEEEVIDETVSVFA